MNNKKFSILLYDVMIAALLFISFALTLNFNNLTSELILAGIIALPVILFVYFAVFRIFKLYNVIWRYASASQYLKLFAASLISTVIFTSVAVPLIGDTMPNLLDICLMVGSYHIIIIIMSRLAYSIYRKKTSASKYSGNVKHKRTLIVGAGWTASAILNELKEKNSSLFPVGFVDDDKDKQKREINDIPICGTTEDIPKICSELEIDTILFAIPSCDSANRRRIINICMKTKCEIKVLPYMHKLVENSDMVSQIQSVKIEDLLGREQVDVKSPEVTRFIKDKICLVTGGGGSIGSELVRQLALCSPAKILIIDSYENGAYDIQQEIKNKHPEVSLHVEIFSVADYDRLDKFFLENKPDIVFHAAAHKHVPLMETNPEQAVKNNVVGTFNTAKAAAKYKTKRFVLISTDKAVNPTNVMGATKKICELIMSYMTSLKTDTSFVAVRFGNVLGSNGSVIPLFKKQIEMGGPVTVTHPDIIRYFMTIPEAVALVMRTSVLAKGGEIFVLDMGEQVKILTLVENLIKLSGFEPYTEIPVQFIGLRPGEKLYEELLIKEDGLEKTAESKIFVTKQVPIDKEKFEKDIDTLVSLANKNDAHAVIEKIKEIVPTFHHNA